MARTELIDPNAVDQITLLNEVISKRQQEVQEAKVQLENVRSKITSERVQWSTQRAEEDAEQKERFRKMEEAYQQKLHLVDEDVRQAHVALQNQRALEAAAEQRVAEANQRLAELEVLADERLQVQRLKKQLDERSIGLEEREAAAKTQADRGRDALQAAQKLQDDVERQRLILNDREAALATRQESLLLRERQLEVVEQRVDQKLTQSLPLPTPSSDRVSPETIPVEPAASSEEGATQESVNAHVAG